MTDDYVATYRLQICRDFTLSDAANALPYLKALGITHLYLSPVFESMKGSTHGYDICDFTKISAERGGEEAFSALNDLCLSNNMRLILDIVPNHMGIAGENPFWLDVLAKGRQSRYWDLFDLRVDEHDKIHLPILSKSLEEALSCGDACIEEHETYGRVLSLNGRILPLGEHGPEDQAYKPVLWTEAFDKISYRRFFDITDLIGVRVEDRKIYDMTHQCLLELCEKYKAIAGVRVDHIDGLADPTTYLTLLNNDIDTIWVEKILAADETLPQSWPVKGTTGYEFIARLNDLMVDAKGFRKIEDYWRRNVEQGWNNFQNCVYESKEHILDTLFPSELKRLVSLSKDIGTAAQAEIFWRGLIVCLDVYRTYAGEKPLTDSDKERIQRATQIARKRFGKPYEEAESLFLPVLLDPQTDIQRQIVREWQQLSGPAMAKGLEDCAHYRYTPLTALNEVGCESAIRDNGRERYHEWCAHMVKSYPLSLLATSTHDTKRSEDARARLYTLADKPDEWISFYEEAVKTNAALRQGFVIRPATEYFLYQAIVAIWPWDSNIDDTFTDRIADYMLKSVKEARVETNWLKPDEAYENALKNYVRKILHHQPFLNLVTGLVRSVAYAGVVNSITALTLKILGPSVPDFYQGADGWDFSLVDPDNRRPVRFDNRSVPECRPDDWRSPMYKIWHTRKLLEIRRHHCNKGDALTPISITGPQAAHVIAYRKGALIVICPLHAGQVATGHAPLSIDAELALESGTYKNLLDDAEYVCTGPLSLQAMLKTSPVAVLWRQD